MLKCSNEKLEGSWTQNDAFSPGIGQGYSVNGDVVTAFFSFDKTVIIEFAEKYFNKKVIKIAKVEPPKQIEVSPNISKDKTHRK